jgi:4-azaleucine resistance transporter AzlC
MKSKEFFDGVKATIPMIVGAIPFGIIFGTLAEPSGLSWIGALAMSIFVYAGASQFIALGMLAAGATAPIIIATTFVVNLRHMLYAANMVPKVRHLPLRWRAVMAFGLTDETFASVNNRFMNSNSGIENAHWFYLGSFIAMYGNWILCTLLGISLGELFPDMTSWGLDFAMAVTFIGMVMPYLRNRPMIAAAVTAGALSIVTYTLPNKLGLMASGLSGVCVGFALSLALKTQVTDPDKASQKESQHG